MLSCYDLGHVFEENGLTFFAGVPDSTFKNWMKFLADGHGLTNVIASNECEATAIVSGYHLATEKLGVVYMQNSGLGKIVNPHTSLLSKEVYSIPAIYMIGWRGEPGKTDEPQHKMIGRIMIPLLDTLEIPYQVLPDKIEGASEVIRKAKEQAEKNKSPSVIIIKKGTLKEYISKNVIKTNYEMSRDDAIKTIVDRLDEKEIIVSTTGKTSRELFEYREKLGQRHGKDFLTVGSMGCASSIALGIALQKPNKPIYIFDGDGAAIMQMGTFATIGSKKPKNLQHILFDNQTYDSTGGQPTVSSTVNFAQIALACGYNFSQTAKTKKELIYSMEEMKKNTGPNLLIVKVNKGARKDLGRPTTTPIENKEEFIKELYR
ncbi:MAG: phosphonopyruvate decarboxylase [Nanoarchaeota archaeon]|nr:phosphonopyruvate decarboxylase [Nanoarchaeota archaeon]